MASFDSQLPSDPTIINHTFAGTDSEESEVFSPGVRAFSLKLRDVTHTMKLAFTSGASGTTYITIQAGGEFFKQFLGGGQLTLFIQSPDAGAIAELIFWK